MHPHLPSSDCCTVEYCETSCTTGVPRSGAAVRRSSNMKVSSAAAAAARKRWPWSSWGTARLRGWHRVASTSGEHRTRMRQLMAGVELSRL